VELIHHPHKADGAFDGLIAAALSLTNWFTIQASWMGSDAKSSSIEGFLSRSEMFPK
jgi:hypothetical protein